jgi:type IV secretion system protein TrbL
LAVSLNEGDIFQPMTGAVTEEAPSIIAEVVNEFLERSQDWSYKLEETVKKLFRLLLTLELVMLAITALIKRESLENIFGSMLMAAVVGGIIYVCIVNYAEWSEAIMIGLINYTGIIGYDPDVLLQPILKGFAVFNSITHSMAFDSPIKSLISFISGIIILLCFALITIQIIYVKCEAAVAVGAGFILLGFGGCSFFREYATNLLRYIISVGFKLYVLYLVLGLGFAFIEEKIVIPTNMSYSDLGALIVIAFLLLALTKALPDVASGIIQGAQVNTGGHMSQAITQTAVIAGGAAIAGRNFGGQALNFKEASTLAKSMGTPGLGGAVKVFREARNQAKLDGNASPRHVQSKLEAMRQSLNMDKNKGGA